MNTKTFEAIEKLKEVELELHRLKNALEMANKALAQPEQKPMHPQLKTMLEEYFDKCFAESAPQRTWVGLTDEEAQQTFAKHNCTISTHLAGILTRAIEAKLKEKNT